MSKKNNINNDEVKTPVVENDNDLKINETIIENSDIENKITNIQAIDEEIETPVVENDDVDDDISIKEVDEKFTVVFPFKDLNDNEYEYQVNKTYPRENMTNEEKIVALSQERLSQLTTSNNKIGRILIVKSED